MSAEKESHLVAKNSDNFTKDNRWFISNLLLAQLILLGFLAAFFVLQYNEVPTPILFRLNEGYKVFHDKPTDLPMLSEAEVNNFVATVIRDLYSFNYSNAGRHLQQVNGYFDERGWKSFVSSVQSNKLMQAINPKQLIVTSSPLKGPNIVEQGVLPDEGRYVWKVIIPIQLLYENATSKARQNMELTLIIWRVHFADNLKGVVITNYVAKVTSEEALQVVTR